MVHPRGVDDHQWIGNGQTSIIVRVNSTSSTFVFTAVLLYGPAAGTLIVVLDALSI